MRKTVSISAISIFAIGLGLSAGAPLAATVSRADSHPAQLANAPAGGMVLAQAGLKPESKENEELEEKARNSQNASDREIVSAIEHLRQARYILNKKAMNDYQGHKANALDAIHRALRELHAALKVK